MESFNTENEEESSCQRLVNLEVNRYLNEMDDLYLFAKLGSLPSDTVAVDQIAGVSVILFTILAEEIRRSLL
jgi:hypothetical protein